MRKAFDFEEFLVFYREKCTWGNLVFKKKGFLRAIFIEENLKREYDHALKQEIKEHLYTRGMISEKKLEKMKNMVLDKVASLKQKDLSIKTFFFPIALLLIAFNGVLNRILDEVKKDKEFEGVMVLILVILFLSFLIAAGRPYLFCREHIFNRERRRLEHLSYILDFIILETIDYQVDMQDDADPEC